MFRVTLVALLGIGGAQEDSASLLQKRSRNALVSQAADVIKHTGITQLDEAVTGKECKAFLGGEEPSLISDEQKKLIYNSAWFDGLEHPEELGVALACPHHILGDEDFPFPDKRESKKTCKNKEEAVKECSTALKKSCKWLKSKGSKIINQRSSRASRGSKITGEFARAHSIIDSLDCNAYREPTQKMFDDLFAAFGDLGPALNYAQILGGHLGATESLPPAILAFYGAVQGLFGDKALTALQFIDDDAYWAHTGMATAIGKEQIDDLFSYKNVHSKIAQTNTVQYIATDGDASSGASSYVVTRYGAEFGSVDGTDRKREAFVLVGGIIKMVWTTNGHEDDPTTDDGSDEPWYDANHILVSGGDGDAAAVEAAQSAIEAYVDGFVGHDASGMQSTYHETNPLFMADFKPERKAPVACSASADCGTFPYFNTFDDLLPAFEAFVGQPSHIELNRKFTPAGVFGDFAYVSTVTYGCEGNMVTPEGDTPAPNRELFVATRTDADGWKIRFYMFSIDPNSPITPPVEICDLNRDTTGSVWPTTTTTTDAPAVVPWTHLGATKSLPPAILAFYAAMESAFDAEELSTALQFIDDDAYWSHTGLATAIGKEAIGDLFSIRGVRSMIAQTNTVQYVATDGDASSGASSYVVTRHGFTTAQVNAKRAEFGSIDEFDADRKREAFVLVGGKIKMVWTTNGDENDPTTDDGSGEPWYDANHILVSGGDGDAAAVEAAQSAIEAYVDGFVGHDASGMQSTYHETNPLFMADFKPERKAPVACSASADCGTFPYLNTFDDLLPAFEAFVGQPSHIELNRKFTPAEVFGDFAYVSTVTYGCEGNMVTPEGDTPAPNRELFVATRTDADGWKIRFYMFSIDPNSPITPPVEICDLNRDTTGSVWPPITTVAPAVTEVPATEVATTVAPAVTEVPATEVATTTAP